MASSTTYDAVVVGAGPNGLAAAINLQLHGLSVLVIEAKDTIGGGMRTAELTLPGFRHDVCSAVHPMAAASPFFTSLPLENFGLEYLYPDVYAAHPLDNGNAVALYDSLEQTAEGLGNDSDTYTALIEPIVNDWTEIDKDLLGPLRIPRYPMPFTRFGLKAISAASTLVKRFATTEARALWAGMAAHAVQPLSNLTTSAIGLVLLSAAHRKGWPVPKGGSQTLADALAAYFTHLGGKIETGTKITSLAQLPTAKAVVFDLPPAQLLKIAGHTFSPLYRWQLNNFKYGMGVYKVDWALDDVVPFTSDVARKAGTLHLGGTFEEIATAEAQTAKGKHPDHPFVLLAQQSVIDASRAPQGKHTLWGYCHVPNGSTENMTDKIEQQVERFAPGFRDRILARHVMNTQDLESYNANYIGGDINGGSLDITQLFTRPALRSSPYRTSKKGIYICSASTPPGGGVHGMGGYHASVQVLKDIFKIRES
ncbi:MAG: NAD(P)/FAD-dependent oxidoreductase [Filimonas sp.]|nr:NAD(P)/FAD-dependent oxidoreductase [Filimonas sp.]